MRENQSIILNVYFAGSPCSISKEDTQVGSFANGTIAEDITKSSDSDIQNHIKQNKTHFKMSFDGCGREDTYGIRGFLFGRGIEEQCASVVAHVNKFIQTGKKVILNAVGISRGGIASIFLAKMLGAIEKAQLETNLLLLDSVPGNLIVSQKNDVFGLTTASKALDLSASKNLNDVIELYPYVPIPARYFHAPLVAKYPKNVEPRRDVLLGEHLGAFGRRLCEIKNLMSYYYIRRFLSKHGTSLNLSQTRLSNVPANISSKDFLQGFCKRMNRELLYYLPRESTVRSAHCYGPYTTNICCASKNSENEFLNILHAELSEVEASEIKKKKLALYIKTKAQFFPKKTFIMGVICLLVGGITLWAMLSSCAVANAIAGIMPASTLSIFSPVLLFVGGIMLAGAILYYLNKKYSSFPTKSSIFGVGLILIGVFAFWAKTGSSIIAVKIAAIISIPVLSVLWPVLLSVGVGVLAASGLYFFNKKYNLFSCSSRQINSDERKAKRTDNVAKKLKTSGVFNESTKGDAKNNSPYDNNKSQSSSEERLASSQPLGCVAYENNNDANEIDINNQSQNI